MLSSFPWNPSTRMKSTSQDHYYFTRRLSNPYITIDSINNVIRGIAVRRQIHAHLLFEIEKVHWTSELDVPHFHDYFTSQTKLIFFHFFCSILMYSCPQSLSKPSYYPLTYRIRKKDESQGLYQEDVWTLPSISSVVSFLPSPLDCSTKGTHVCDLQGQPPS